MKRRTGTFTARGDDGREYTVYIRRTPSKNVGSRDDLGAMLEGINSYELSDGSPVNRRDKGVYEIVSTGVILRSDSPDAF